MTLYTYTGPAPETRTLRFVPNGGFSRSVLSGAIQTISRPGSRWEMELIWKNLTHDKHSQVLGFFSRLNGAEHRARIPLYGYTRQGNAAGSPLVNGAGQAGNSLIFDGVAEITDYFKAGDFFTFEQNGVVQLKRVTADLSTVVGSNTVNFVPEIRQSPDNNAAISYDSLSADWVLTSPVEDTAARANVDSNVDALVDVRLTFIDDLVG